MLIHAFRIRHEMGIAVMYIQLSVESRSSCDLMDDDDIASARCWISAALPCVPPLLLPPFRHPINVISFLFRLLLTTSS